MNPDKMLSSGLNTNQLSAILGDVRSAIVIAGTTQSDATAIKDDVNILTSGTGGVRLPRPSHVGQEVQIYNRAGAAATIYPSSGGKINNGTADAGIVLSDGFGTILKAINNLDWYEFTNSSSADAAVLGPASATDNAIARFDATTGKLVQNSGATIDDSGNINFSAAGGLTAVGTNRATSLALTKQFNLITSAAASTGVTLPAAANGLVVMIEHAGANAITVYAAGSDTIDGVAAATGVPLTNAKRALFICFAAPAWISAQLGVVSA
jgi:hypothetical protein